MFEIRLDFDGVLKSQDWIVKYDSSLIPATQVSSRKGETGGLNSLPRETRDRVVISTSSDDLIGVTREQDTPGATVHRRVSENRNLAVL